jgi:hypothetical protein
MMSLETPHDPTVRHEPASQAAACSLTRPRQRRIALLRAVHETERAVPMDSQEFRLDFCRHAPYAGFCRQFEAVEARWP